VKKLARLLAQRFELKSVQPSLWKLVLKIARKAALMWLPKMVEKLVPETAQVVLMLVPKLVEKLVRKTPQQLALLLVPNYV
jgi:hypothetical protein